MTKVLGKADLLKANLKRVLVPVPELGASLWMQEMTAEHVIEFKKFIDKLRADGNKETTLEQDVELMTLVISFSACDENGSLLFSQEEARGLMRNNLNVLMELGNKALELSGVKVGGGGFTSEVADNLPKAPSTSLSVTSPANSRKRGRKS